MVTPFQVVLGFTTMNKSKDGEMLSMKSTRREERSIYRFGTEVELYTLKIVAFQTLVLQQFPLKVNTTKNGKFP